MRAPIILLLILLLTTTTYTYSENNNLIIFGGNGDEGSHSTGVSEDSNGDIFLYGVTTSSDLDTTSDVFDKDFNGGQDLFVAKYSHDFSTLLACTYIGGSQDEISAYLVIGSDDKIYLAGVTMSSDLPVTENAHDTNLSGTDDMFVAKFNNDLSQLEALTYIGGRSRETAARAFLTIDDEAYLYLTGYTESSDFPTTEGAYDTNYNSRGDSFLTKLDQDLNVIASTYVGGSSNDWAYAVANSGDSVYITGHTDSNDYPVTEGSYDEGYNSGVDVFITRLSDDLSTLEASTYIGGSLFDNTATMIFDEDGNIWIAGHTASSNYPITSGAYSDIYNGGHRDIFISCLNPELSELIASTYLGGSQNDYQPFLAYGSGSIWVSGSTLSNDFPVTTDALQAQSGGDIDYCLSELSPDMTILRSSTYLGGSGEDWFGIILWTTDGLLVTGSTDSTDFMRIDNQVQNMDVFLLRYASTPELKPNSEPSPSPEPTPEPSPKPGGIPGFTRESVILGLMIGVVILWLRQRG
jgi:hypothetical protein